ncbi:MAG: hypothetical protein MUF64_26870 [Polyangiaceae bacterium]|nr:hypothetical protein [Polyangiaceae bacterium]
MATVLHGGPLHVVATNGPVFFVGFQGPPDETTRERYEAALARHVASTAAPRIYLHVARSTKRSAEAIEQVRAMYTRILRRHRRDFCAAALVLPETGFGNAMIRGILTGLVRLVPEGAEVQIFDALAPACTWLEQKHRAGKGTRFPAALAVDVEQTFSTCRLPPFR